MSVLSTHTARNGTLRGASGFVGFGKDGAEDIMRHPWFAGINWDSELECVLAQDIADIHRLAQGGSTISARVGWR